MSEMIDRVALAIDQLADTDFEKRLARERAVRAIEAMSYPTEGMVDAGWNARGEVDDRYRAMILAALTPPQRTERA